MGFVVDELLGRSLGILSERSQVADVFDGFTSRSAPGETIIFSCWDLYNGHDCSV